MNQSSLLMFFWILLIWGGMQSYERLLSSLHFGFDLIDSKVFSILQWWIGQNPREGSSPARGARYFPIVLLALQNMTLQPFNTERVSAHSHGYRPGFHICNRYLVLIPETDWTFLQTTMGICKCMFALHLIPLTPINSMPPCFSLLTLLLDFISATGTSC